MGSYKLASGSQQYVLGHELGHSAYYALPPEAKKAVKSLYDQYMANKSRLISKVALQDEHEFFAEYFSLGTLHGKSLTGIDAVIWQVLQSLSKG